jgi:hypothetical protein
MPQLKTTREQLKLINVISIRGILNDLTASRLVESTDSNIADACSLDRVSFSVFITFIPLIHIDEASIPVTFHYGKY